MKLSFSIIISFVLIVSFTYCKENNRPKNQKHPAEFLNSYKTKVPEPSDLALSYDRKAVWTVSDETNKAYLISFEGKILKTIKLKSEDPEGITVIDDTTLAVVFERKRTLVKITTKGKELERKTFKELKGDLNSGLEGVTYNPNNKHFFMVNEKSPRLFIELDPDLNIIQKKEITYAKDYSGIFYDKEKDRLWIISDESSMIGQCDFEGNLIESFRVKVPQMEGIAVDHIAKRIYAISDLTGELFVYGIGD